MGSGRGISREGYLHRLAGALVKTKYTSQPVIALHSHMKAGGVELSFTYTYLHDKLEQESKINFSWEWSHDLVNCLYWSDIMILLWFQVLSMFALWYFLFSNFPQDCIYDPLKSDNQIVYLLSKLSILQIMSRQHKKIIFLHPTDNSINIWNVFHSLF